MTETVLQVNSLNKRFGKLTAVDNISFKVQKGNVYGLLGPNGSGKTTTLGILLNTTNPSSGNWNWFGESFTSTNSLKKIGAILEHPNFYTYLNAEQNLKISCAIKETSFSRIDEVLELVGLLNRKNDVFSTYSLGMKQRLAIASAMINKPEVLILDEPTNGLDPEGIIQIRQLINLIAKNGTTILLASHLLDEVEKVCSHVIILKNGQSLYTGPVNELTNTNGYFELNSPDKNKLKEALTTIDEIEEIIDTGTFLKVLLKNDLEASRLNENLSHQGIYLDHLVKRKQSLEEQFIELVNK